MRKQIGSVVSRFCGPLLHVPSPDNNEIPKMDRGLRITEGILRFAVVIFALVSVIIVRTTSATRDIAGMQIHANFTLLKTLPFLVTVDGILAVYSLLQGLNCFMNLYRRNILLSQALAWTIFCCDQAMAYVTFAAATATAEAASISQQGLEEFEWIKVCMFFRVYCLKSGVGMVNAFLAALCMVFVSGMSLFHLFRLYGGKGAKKTRTDQ